MVISILVMVLDAIELQFPTFCFFYNIKVVSTGPLIGVVGGVGGAILLLLVLSVILLSLLLHKKNNRAKRQAGRQESAFL